MKHNAHILRVYNKQQLTEEMRYIGADEAGIKLMLPKGEQLLIKLQNINLKAANIIKQEMLSKGGEAVLHKDVSRLTIEHSEIILIGTKKQFSEVIKKFKAQPFGLKGIADELEQVIKANEEQHTNKILRCNWKELTLNKQTLIMGILNITPDSFSDGGKYFNGKYFNIEEAVKHAKKMVEAGADIIDVGGESTRPGHKSVSLEEELERVIPVVEALSREITVPISIDTYKAEVAKKAVEAGADIINDVWGFKRDHEIAGVAARLDVPVILMHNRERGSKYISLIDDIIADLRESIDIALSAGVKSINIILDPGIGFAKTYEENLIVMNRLDEIVALGYPVLLGTSRKSMIGNTLNLPVTERVEGTAATVAMGIVKGCKIMRVHDVKEMKRVAQMMDAMVYPNRR